eukprot:2502657-Prymnesium_polylepis.1
MLLCCRSLPAHSAFAHNSRLISALDSYMIELEFHEKCVTEDNSKRYVRAETVIAQQTDYFRDATDMCGEVFSPTVSIEFEGLNALTDKSNHASLGHSYTLTMPHCFNPEQVDYN